MYQPLIIHGSFGDVPVTIFGEIHNQMDPSFYEALDMRKKTVLVEHSTVLCSLRPHEEAFFKNANGSEWVWFMRSKQGKPIECVDNRIENGYMSGMDERQLRYALDKIEDEESLQIIIKELLDQTISLLKKVHAQQAQLKSIWDDVKKVIDRIKVQTQDILKLMHLKHIPSEIAQEVYEKGVELFDNLVRVSSMTVDANILRKLEEYKGKQPIYIFVGLNHALRIQKWTGWAEEPNRTIDVDDFRTRAFGKRAKKRSVKKHRRSIK